MMRFSAGNNREDYTDTKLYADFPNCHYSISSKVELP